MIELNKPSCLYHVSTTRKGRTKVQLWRTDEEEMPELVGKQCMCEVDKQSYTLLNLEIFQDCFEQSVLLVISLAEWSQQATVNKSKYLRVILALLFSP